MMAVSLTKAFMFRTEVTVLVLLEKGYRATMHMDVWIIMLLTAAHIHGLHPVL